MDVVAAELDEAAEVNELRIVLVGLEVVYVEFAAELEVEITVLLAEELKTELDISILVLLRVLEAKALEETASELELADASLVGAALDTESCKSSDDALDDSADSAELVGPGVASDMEVNLSCTVENPVAVAVDEYEAAWSAEGMLPSMASTFGDDGE